MLVPWVALWTSEQSIKPVTLGPNGVETGYTDVNGVHWIVYGDSPGEGEPLFGHVHTGRQVQCMRKPRCQVCGQKMQRSPCYWILNGQESQHVKIGQSIVTQTPPVCRPCIKTARENCPHLLSLGKDVWVLKVQRYRCVAAVGDLVSPNGQLQPHTLFRYGHPMLAFVVARQVVAELTEWERIVLDS